MPLSPAISTPRPRTSISTAWIIVRSASESSRMDDSFAIAVGVAIGVFITGRRARSASSRSSPGGAKPPVISTQGKSRVRARRSDVVRPAVSRLSRYRISLSPKISTRPGLRYSWKPASARPVFWMCGLVMARSRPAAPARTSSGNPNASGCDASNVETVTPWVTGMNSRSSGDPRLAALRVCLDQRHLAVRAPEQHDERLGLDVAEDDDALVAGVDLAGSVGHRHRPDHLPRGPQDWRHSYAVAAGSRGRRRLHGRRALGALAILTRGDDSGFRRVALARLALAF